MKFDLIENDSVSVGAIKTHAISISANAKAYRLIFGQIYPDIIKAVVRELFTNAWDSQKKAGTLDRAIEIHAPYSVEPWYSVRDYGTGMTPDVITSVYARVFESTKDQSNEEAGMFGMGSKTPLGYTDSFNVSSYVDGTVWVYSIHITPGGEARIDLVHTGETDEPNGVDVNVPVRLDDINTFCTYIERFTSESGTLCTVNTVPTVPLEKLCFLDMPLTANNYASVRMGCVVYSLDINKVRTISNIPQWELPIVMLRNVIIDVPIGTFDVTGSREDIIYNRESVTLLIEIAQELQNKIIHNINEQIAAAPSYPAACTIYQELASLRRGAQRDVKWRSFRVDNYSMMHKLKASIRLSYDSFTRRKSVERALTLGIYSKDTQVHIIWDDGETKSVNARVMRLQDNVRADDNVGKRQNIYIIVDTVASLNMSKRSLLRLRWLMPSDAKYYNIADLEKPVVTRAPVAAKSKAEWRVLRDTGVSSFNTSLIRYTIPTPTYYVCAKRNQVEGSYSEIKSALTVLGVSDSAVAVINDSHINMITEYNLLNLLEVAVQARANIRYSPSRVLQNVWQRVQSDRSYLISSSVYASSIARLLNIAYDSTDAYGSYLRDANPQTIADDDAMYECICNKLADIYKRHPALQFVNISYDSKFTEVMTTLGEMN